MWFLKLTPPGGLSNPIHLLLASRCYIHPKSFFVSTMSMYWVFLLILSQSNLVPDSRSILVRTILTRHYMLHYSSQSLHTKITKHLNQTRISKHLRGRFRSVCPRVRDSHHQQGRIDFNTVDRIFWSTPRRMIDDERMSVLHQNSGGIGKSIPSALEISLDPRDFPRASPSGNLSGVGDGFPNTSLVLVEHGYNTSDIKACF